MTNAGEHPAPCVQSGLSATAEERRHMALLQMTWLDL